jgi:hypothetical protein
MIICFVIIFTPCKGWVGFLEIEYSCRQFLMPPKFDIMMLLKKGFDRVLEKNGDNFKYLLHGRYPHGTRDRSPDASRWAS